MRVWEGLSANTQSRSFLLFFMCMFALPWEFLVLSKGFLLELRLGFSEILANLLV